MYKANDTVDRDEAAEMLADAVRFASTSITVDADKNYEAAGFVAMCRCDAACGAKLRMRGRVPGPRLTRQRRNGGCAISQLRRERIEYRGLWRVDPVAG